MAMDLVKPRDYEVYILEVYTLKESGRSIWRANWKVEGSIAIVSTRRSSFSASMSVSFAQYLIFYITQQVLTFINFIHSSTVIYYIHSSTVIYYSNKIGVMNIIWPEKSREGPVNFVGEDPR